MKTKKKMEKQIQYQIKVELPPVAEKCVKAFGINPLETFFAYGDTVYNPGNNPIAFHVLAHEMAHLYQQKEMGGPEKWWDRYIDDCVFRLLQEAEAYAVQYKIYCQKFKDRNNQDKFLRWLGGELSSENYGSMIPLSDAISVIKNYKPKQKK